MYITKIYKVILCMVLLVTLFLPNFAYAQSQSEAFYQSGNASAAQGKYDLAIANYTKAIELNPQYAKAYNNRGLSYCNKTRYDLAVADFTKAIEINPQKINYYLSRADAYRFLYERRLAVDDYNRVLKMDPNNSEAFHGKRDTLYGTGYYDTDSYIIDTSYNPFQK